MHCILILITHAQLLHNLLYMYRPFSSRDLMTFFEMFHLCAQVNIGRGGQRKAFGYHCIHVRSQLAIMSLALFFSAWVFTSFHGKNIKVLRDLHVKRT